MPATPSRTLSVNLFLILSLSLLSIIIKNDFSSPPPPDAQVFTNDSWKKFLGGDVDEIMVTDSCPRQVRCGHSRSKLRQTKLRELPVQALVLPDAVSGRRLF